MNITVDGAGSWKLKDIMQRKVPRSMTDREYGALNSKLWAIIVEACGDNVLSLLPGVPEYKGRRAYSVWCVGQRKQQFGYSYEEFCRLQEVVEDLAALAGVLLEHAGNPIGD